MSKSWGTHGIKAYTGLLPMNDRLSGWHSFGPFCIKSILVMHQRAAFMSNGPRPMYCAAWSHLILRLWVSQVIGISPE